MNTGLTEVQVFFSQVEKFNWRADALMGWIRSKGLDISCTLWPNGAACVTYDMAIIPIEGKCWQETTEEELLGNPALAPGAHSPRRLLVLGHNRPDTYMFRTAEGTVGMLRIIGLGQHEPGVTIRYKLINPAKSVVAKKRSPDQTRIGSTKASGPSIAVLLCPR